MVPGCRVSAVGGQVLVVDCQVSLSVVVVGSLLSCFGCRWSVRYCRFPVSVVAQKKGTEIDSDAGESEKDTLIKKKIKFSSYIRNCRVEQLQSHI